LLKVSKIIRIFRVLKFISELRVLLDCIFGCLYSLMWSLVLISFVLVMFSTFFVQEASSFLLEESVEPHLKEALKNKFGSVHAGMLTLFMATSGGDDWSNIFDVVSQMGTFDAAVFIFMICLFVVALWNIVTSVFIDRALRTAARNFEMLAMEKQRADLQDAQDFLRLLRSGDTNDDDTITLEEFMDMMSDEKHRTKFEVHGLDIKDAPAFYQMISESLGTKVLRVADFAIACMRLKGGAVNVDQSQCRFEVKRLKVLGRQQSERLQALEDQLLSVVGLFEALHNRGRGGLGGQDLEALPERPWSVGGKRTAGTEIAPSDTGPPTNGSGV